MPLHDLLSPRFFSTGSTKGVPLSCREEEAATAGSPLPLSPAPL